MKDRILVVDDEKTLCEVLQLQLQAENYEVEVAYDGQEALEKIGSFLPQVVVTDILMPRVNGIELCRKIKATEETRFVPVVIMTTLSDRTKRLEALGSGADEFLNKPVDSMEMITRIKSLVRMKKLIDELEDTKNIIRMLAYAIEAKDGYTEEHSERVIDYSLSLASKCGLSEESKKVLEMGALLHDVGKIGIPEAILLKPGKLTPEEYDVIKRHPDIGVQICKPLKFLKEVIKVIQYHHERFDGNGYPQGLKGDQIPIEARIISIADAYDAMTSDRPYRKGMPKEKAIQILKEERGAQWDAVLVDIFLQILETGE